MMLNRTELKKIQYEFNSLSNRLLQADFDDYNDVLRKYVRFLNETDIINDYIKGCGESDQDMALEFNEVQTHHAIFSLGDTTEEEIRNVYAILQFIVENDVKVYCGIGISYSHSRNYQEILNDFNNRVTLVLIRNIETYLTKVGIDMGLNDNVSYNISVKDGQVNIANNNASINATNTINGIDTDEFTILVDTIKAMAQSSNLSSDDTEVVNNNLEVIGEEIQKDKPRRGFIKTAINGLKAIKGTAEFGAAIIALIQFVQPFIG